MGTAKDEDSRVAGFHEEDIPPEGCGKGAEEASASAAAEAQAHGPESRTPPVVCPLRHRREERRPPRAGRPAGQPRRGRPALLGRLGGAVPPSFVRRLLPGPPAAGARARAGAGDLSGPLLDPVAGLGPAGGVAGACGDDAAGQETAMTGLGRTRRGRRRTRSAWARSGSGPSCSVRSVAARSRRRRPAAQRCPPSPSLFPEPSGSAGEMPLRESAAQKEEARERTIHLLSCV